MLCHQYKKVSQSVKRFSAFIAVSSLLLGASTCLAKESAGKSQGSMQARNAELAKVRAATNQYKDVQVALTAGYISSIDMGAGCASAIDEGEPAQLGGMGIHLVKLDGFGEASFNFADPGVLVYLPDPSIEHCTYSTAELMQDPSCRNSLSLAAVEEIVFAHMIEPEGDSGYWENVPEFADQQFYYRHDNPETTWVDEAHGFPPHYELHIWLFEHNPAGLFAPWNPNVTCPNSMQGHH